MQDPITFQSMKPPFPKQEHEHLKCPRCDSADTRFCYYNNNSLSQPRHFCKNCRRYWTKGGALRNIPVGGSGALRGSRKNVLLGQFRNLLEGLKSSGSSVQRVPSGEFPDNPSSSLNLNTSGEPALELQSTEKTENFLGLQGDSCCSGSGNGWPHLAVYTPERRIDISTMSPMGAGQAEPYNLSSDDSSASNMEEDDVTCPMETATKNGGFRLVEDNLSFGDSKTSISWNPITEAYAFTRRARMYQEYMKQIPIPNLRGSLIPFRTWQGLAKSLKQLYWQPLHYLTNVCLKQWDRARLGSDEEHQPLDTIIHPLKAEATIWLMEEVHRQTTSHHHLAHLWASDSTYRASMDPIFPPLGNL